MISESPPLTRAVQKSRTRQALLDAAVEVISERGLEGATARSISDRAGVAAGTFFVHFPEVPALLETLLDEHLERSLSTAYRSLPDGLSLIDALVHVADGLFEGYGREPDLGRACLAATMFRVESSGPAAARLAEFRTWVLGRLAAAQQAGEITATVELDVVFETFFCLYVGLLVAGLRNELDRVRQLQLLRTMLAALLGHGS